MEAATDTRVAQTGVSPSEGDAMKHLEEQFLKLQKRHTDSWGDGPHNTPDGSHLPESRHRLVLMDHKKLAETAADLGIHSINLALIDKLTKLYRLSDKVNQNMTPVLSMDSGKAELLLAASAEYRANPGTSRRR